MAVTAKQVAELRQRTGAGMMDAKNALVTADGDVDKAIEELQKKGMARAAKKADRSTNEGLVYAYIHSNGKLGAMVQVNCETDFVAMNEAFQTFVKDLAMHVSAADPLYVKREDVPEEVSQKQMEIFKEEAASEGKPANIVEKIVEGKMNKWFSEVVLLEQAYIKDEDMTISDLVTSKVASLGENIQVNRISRFLIG